MPRKMQHTIAISLVNDGDLNRKTSLRSFGLWVIVETSSLPTSKVN